MGHPVDVKIDLDRDVFLRTLVRELATSLESVIGLQEASGYISLVGQAVGTQIDEMYLEALHICHRGQMATAAYLLHHRPTRTLTYVKAGHPPPLVVCPDGSSRYLDGPVSPPVGPVPDARYRQGETTLADGAAVLLYTDGLIERRRERLDVGLERLTETARRGTGLDVHDLCELFLDHQPGAEYPDDRALLLIRPDFFSRPAR
ncbi:PP2C family protein-serine/threonine phosphatase [Streptomyces sp. NPDC001388]|uniref:PP2C family protein-serine/threonine phosphatase n=1 Tax=Streptomyces sp. NPDC001388 TaxID=3364568 RepID=UPI0036C8D017